MTRKEDRKRREGGRSRAHRARNSLFNSGEKAAKAHFELHFNLAILKQNRCRGWILRCFTPPTAPVHHVLGQQGLGLSKAAEELSVLRRVARVAVVDL